MSWTRNIRTVKIKIKHPIQNFNDLDTAIEGKKFKFKSKNKISINNDDAQLDIWGVSPRPKTRSAAESMASNCSSAMNFSSPSIQDQDARFFQGPEGPADGDFLPMNKLLFGKPLDIKGSDGDDQIFGGRKASQDINGRGGNDTLLGSDGNDTLIGGPGNDFLYAGFGNDNLDGSSGQNVLHGDLGNDYFAFSALDGSSQISSRSGRLHRLGPRRLSGYRPERPHRSRHRRVQRDRADRFGYPLLLRADPGLLLRRER